MKVTLEIDLPYLTEEGEIENDIQEEIIKGGGNDRKSIEIRFGK